MEEIRNQIRKDEYQWSSWRGYSYKACRKGIAKVVNDYQNKIFEQYYENRNRNNMNLDDDYKEDSNYDFKQYVKFMNDNKLKLERKQLDITDFSNILKLRTGVNRLDYFRYIKLDQGTNGLCKNCHNKKINNNDTIEHYILHCNEWNIQRKKMFKRMEHIYNEYNQQQKIDKLKLKLNKKNIKQILYPPNLLGDKRYIKCIRLLANFISHTKRNI